MTPYFVWVLIPTFFILGMTFGWGLAMCVKPKDAKEDDDGKQLHDFEGDGD